MHFCISGCHCYQFLQTILNHFNDTKYATRSKRLDLESKQPPPCTLVAKNMALDLLNKLIDTFDADLVSSRLDPEFDTKEGYIVWQSKDIGDSFAVYIDRQTACETVRRICIRPLIRNESHLMQPMDRYVGKAHKEKFRQELLELNAMLTD